MDQNRLKEILNAHTKWLHDERGGQCADLHGADLRKANLHGTDLRKATLYGADLRGANLYGASLYGANLRGANLRKANLRKANLHGANLRGADLRDADLSAFSLVPEVGEFIAWKKLQDEVIAKLLIPAGAKRVSSLVGRKCRSSEAVVLELSEGRIGYSNHNLSFVYEVGKTVFPDTFNDDIRVECANGIHFFITKKEAEEY